MKSDESKAAAEQVKTAIAELQRHDPRHSQNRAYYLTATVAPNNALYDVVLGLHADHAHFHQSKTLTFTKDTLKPFIGALLAYTNDHELMEPDAVSDLAYATLACLEAPTATVSQPQHKTTLARGAGTATDAATSSCDLTAMSLEFVQLFAKKLGQHANVHFQTVTLETTPTSSTDGRLTLRGISSDGPFFESFTILHAVEPPARAGLLATPKTEVKEQIISLIARETAVSKRDLRSKINQASLSPGDRRG